MSAELFDSCDRLDENGVWTAKDDQGRDVPISINTVDQIEGTGCIEVNVPAGVADLWLVKTGQGSPPVWDLSLKPVIRIRLNPDRDISSWNLTLVTREPGGYGWNVHRYSASIPTILLAGQYNEFEVDFRNADEGAVSTEALKFAGELTITVRPTLQPLNLKMDFIEILEGPALPLGITISPKSTTLPQFSTLNFKATPSGGVLPYNIVWIQNGIEVATGETYVLVGNQTGSFGVQAIVTDDMGTIAQSETSTVTVIPPPPAISKLHTEGNKIKDTTGQLVYLRGIQIHGMEDHPLGHWEDINGGIHYNTWDPNIVADNLDAMKRSGYNVVRVHDTVEFWLNDVSGHRQIIKDLLTMAKDRGIYIILTFYHVIAPGGQSRLPYPPYSLPGEDAVIGSEADFIAFWEGVAYELRDAENVLFDLWNEPIGPVGAANDPVAQDSWFNVEQQCIHAIRQYTDALILLHWGHDLWVNMDFPDSPHNDLSWITDSRLQGQNIVYSGHIYGEFLFEAGGRATTIEELRLAFEHVLIPWAVETQNKPVIIGEINTSAAMAEQLQNMLTLLNEYGISYVGFWWWPLGTYALLESGSNYPPNARGEILINAIDEGRPPLPTPTIPIVSIASSLFGLALLYGAVG